MRELYPSIEPYDSGHLQVSETHTIYYEQCGNPDGKVALFIHGGPGSGTVPEYRRFFDPKKYRVILVDQRGCGKSTPFFCLEDNNTQALIADFEKIRLHCGVDQWMLFGGSWGSTLGLAYAQAHPECVTEMILRGIFLGTRAEVDWLFRGKGANFIFPEEWENFIMGFSPVEQQDMVSAYYQRLTSDDQDRVVHSLVQWSLWETSIMQLIPNKESIKKHVHSDNASACAILECHYSFNDFFLNDQQLLQNMDKVNHLPCAIVQGRYDVVCAAKNAWQLHQAWPKSALHIVPDAGHSSMEKGIIDQLVRCTDQFA